MTIFYIISFILMIVGIPLVLGLNAERMTADLMDLIRPKSKLRNRVDDVQKGKQKTGIYGYLNNMHAALEATGKGKLFPIMFLAAAIMFAVGIILCLIIDNIYLIPAVSITLAYLPFSYISGTITQYSKNVKEEMETALSIITNSYLRSDNIIQAAKENVAYIKPPLQHVFKAFVGDATFISSNVKQALYTLREKIDDQIWYEWCTTLIQCQDDRTMKDNLLPIVAKLTDVRIVNNRLKNMMMSVKMEYWTMVGLVVANIPLLKMLNKDWYSTLMDTTIGKITLGISGLAILITAFKLKKYTRPIEYKK